jgi:hypothetical protein
MEAESKRDENHRQCMRIETGLAHEVANQGGLLNECLAVIPADSDLAKRILYFREHRKPMPPPLGYVLVELDRLNAFTERLKALVEAGSIDAQSLAADAAALLEVSRG